MRTPFIQILPALLLAVPMCLGASGIPDPAQAQCADYSRSLVYHGKAEGLVGDVQWIAVEGDLGYAIDGEIPYYLHPHDLSILDLTDPKKPTRITTMPTPGNAFRVFPSGNIVYVLDRSGPPGLHVVDVSDPTSPVILTTIFPLDPEIGSPFFVLESGNLLYVSERQSGLRIFDVSDPSNPVDLSSIPVRSGRLALTGNHLIISSGPVIDVSDPQNPFQAATLPVEDSLGPITIDGTLAYLDHYSGFLTLDVSDPLNVQILGTGVRAFNAIKIIVRGDVAHVALNNNRFVAYDISDPTNPTITNVFRIGGDNGNGVPSVDGFSAAGNFFYFAKGPEGIHVLEVDSDPLFAYEVASTPFTQDLGSSIHGLAVAGPIGYVSSGLTYFSDALLTSYDLSDPLAPALIAITSVPTQGPLAVGGNRIVVCDQYDAGLTTVLNSTNPASPKFNSSEHWGAAKPAIHGEYAYLVRHSGSWFNIHDISIWSNPKYVGNVLTSLVPPDIGASDGRLFVLDGGLRIYDISTAELSEDPAELGFLPMGEAMGVHIEGDLAYVATSSSVEIVDVSDPTTPVAMGSVVVGDTPLDKGIDGVAVLGDYAYFATGGYGVRVIDISDPQSPRMIGVLGLTDALPAQDSGTPRGNPIAALDSGHIVVLVDNLNGSSLFVFEPQCPKSSTVGTPEEVRPLTRPVLSPPSPNPSRSRARMTFTLPEPRKTSIQVFDLRGRLVTTLWQGIPDGPVNLAWNGKDDLGRDRAPGVYFVRAAWEGGTESRRLVRIP